MPATRLLRYIQNQPVRDAGRPADRSGRKRILLGVRSERRAVRHHQPDRIRNRAGRVPVICSFLAACHVAGWSPVASCAPIISDKRNRDATPTLATANQLPEKIPMSGSSRNYISNGSRRPVDLAESAAWCCQCRAPASPPH
jgi:hypothetical protein